MNKLKVVQIVDHFDYGGAQTLVKDLSFELNEMGLDVIVICLNKKNDNNSIAKFIENQNIKIYYLKDQKINLFYINKINTLYCLASMMKKMYKILILERPDVMHMHLSSIIASLPAAILIGVKCRIYTFHTLADRYSKIEQYIFRFYFSLFKIKPVAISHEVANTIEKVLSINAGRITTIFNGENLKNFTSKTNYTINETVKLIHVGRFSKMKNHVEMVKAVNLLKNKKIDFELLFVGDGEEKPYIEEMSNKLGLTEKIKFLGLRDDVNSLLKNADIFLLPSLWEGMPMVLIEAMATGIPIIASKLEGISKMISNYENGLLVNPEAIDISNAIETLIKNEELREKIGQKATLDSEKYSSEFMAKNYKKLYIDILCGMKE